MSSSLLKWIADEAVLHQFVAGLPTLFLLLVVAVCIVVLSKGADWMIDGVVDLAERTGLPRIVIGATIISLGTTTPEAFVSVMAAWMGNPGLALGNGVEIAMDRNDEIGDLAHSIELMRRSLVLMVKKVGGKADSRGTH